MARNDVYLYTNATSPADAVVTAQQNTTAADFPELVLGDSPTFNFYFTDGSASWPSFAGNAQYSVEWTLGSAGSDDSVILAHQTSATAITGGWSMVLPLNTGAIINQLNNARISQAYPVIQLWQQIRVTDPTGYKTTYANIRTNLRLRTAPSGQVLPDDPLPSGYLHILADSSGLLVSPANFLAKNSITIPSGKTLDAIGNVSLNTVIRQSTYGANYGFGHYASNNSSGGGTLSLNDIFAFGYNHGPSGAAFTATDYQLYQGFESDYVNGGANTMEWYVRYVTPASPGPASTFEPFFSGFNKDTDRIFETDIRGDLVQVADSGGNAIINASTTVVSIFAPTTISGSVLTANGSTADDAAVQVAKTFGGSDGSVQRLINVTGTDLAVSSNSSHYLIGSQVTCGELNISANITDSGYRYGLNVINHANSGNFLGTLASQIGIRTSVGVLDSGASGSRTITNSIGVSVESQLADAGTITNGFLLKGAYSGSTTTVTNKWGLHVDGEAKNYLSAKLLIGTTTPAAGHVDLATHTTSAGGVNFFDTPLFRTAAGALSMTQSGAALFFVNETSAAATATVRVGFNSNLSGDLQLDPSSGILYLQNRYNDTSSAVVIRTKASGTPVTAATFNSSGQTNLSVVPEYADNAAAVSGGLSVGTVYRTGDAMKIVHS